MTPFFSSASLLYPSSFSRYPPPSLTFPFPSFFLSADPSTASHTLLFLHFYILFLFPSSILLQLSNSFPRFYLQYLYSTLAFRLLSGQLLSYSPTSFPVLLISLVLPSSNLTFFSFLLSHIFFLFPSPHFY